MDFISLLPLFFFVALIGSILWGFPVAFTLGGVSILFALLFTDMSFFNLLPNRLFGTMTAFLLLAIPLFIFMGQVLEHTGIAEEMLLTMNRLLRGVKGGLVLSIVLVGALLGASTGIVGASVTTMGLLSLPVLIKQGVSPSLSSGVIAASGTLGQIIPPSIVLVLLGSVLNISVGDLFKSALVPSAVLVGGYMIYVLIASYLAPSPSKKITNTGSDNQDKSSVTPSVTFRNVLFSFFAPMLLIIVVLGSIYLGVASPTEAAGLGAFMACILGFAKGKLKWKDLPAVSKKTVLTTGMIFTILFGASSFGLVFRELGGDDFFVSFIENSELSPAYFLLFTMALIFIVGFFIDFIEIIFIFVPILLPIFNLYGFDLVWVGILIGLILQTSFLTPPFGFSLFYLKGVAPSSIQTRTIYRGIVPFIFLQLLTFIIIYLYPSLV